MSHIWPLEDFKFMCPFNVISLAFDNVSLPFGLNSPLPFLWFYYLGLTLDSGMCRACCFPVLGIVFCTFSFSFLLWWSAFILLILLSPGSLFWFLPDWIRFHCHFFHSLFPSVTFITVVITCLHLSSLLESFLQLQGVFWS